MLGLIATLLSALFLTVMVVADKLIIGDCYNDNHEHAWIVSSGAGATFGFILTAIAWLFYVVFIGEGNVLVNYTEAFIFPYGLLILMAGILSIQTLRHYFHCFSEAGDSTAVAGWLAMTPLFIYGLVYSLFTLSTKLNINFGLNFSVAQVSFEFALYTIVATLALVAFERVGGHGNDRKGAYYGQLTLMLIFNVLYTVIIHFTVVRVTEVSGNELASLLVLLPFYWLGFAVGMRPLLHHDRRRDFTYAWNTRIVYYIIVVLFTEIIGMLVFFTEFFGLGTLDPAYVALLIGGHVLLVYVITKWLAFLGFQQQNTGVSTIRLLMIPVSIDRLPAHVTRRITVTLEFSFLIVAISCMYQLSGFVL
jgi:limonene-1,2-epoxide hydrolase